MRPSFTTQVRMTDRTTNSPKSANDEKSVSQQQDDDLEQMQSENKKYTIPKRTPDRPAGGADDERSSRSRDGKSTDGQPAGQQHRLGTHAPHGLAADLAQAADSVQATMDQAQQNVGMAVAMQQMQPPQGLIYNQHQPVYPPAGPGFDLAYLASAQLAAHQSAVAGTPFGGGGYLPSGGYPSQPGGHCNAISTPVASLSEWRGGDEKEHELKMANDAWKKMDDPELMDPAKKPENPDGHPYIAGTMMFKSTTLNPGAVFLGEKGFGRWCETREAVTLEIRNNNNKIDYSEEDVRSSVASEIDRLKDYDDACISDDMPKIMSRHGPYRVTMAAGAALSLIEAEGVTIFRYDPSQGLDDELDFEVEILLPSGRSYP